MRIILNPGLFYFIVFALVLSMENTESARGQTNNVSCLYLDHKHRIWGGTEGEGLVLYDPQKDCFITMQKNLRLPGDVVHCMEEDKEGKLWLGTDVGLLRLQVGDHIDSSYYRLYTTIDGLQDNAFNRNAVFKSAGGELFFGGHKGYNSFRPEELQENRNIPPVVIYASEDNLTLHIAELTEDYLAHTGRYVRVFPGKHNEAPALFKRQGKYWMITSGCTGWEPNAARLAVAEHILGPWKELPNPCRGEGAEKTFYSQGTFILPVEGCKEAWIFMADANPGFTDIEGEPRHLFLPANGKSCIDGDIVYRNGEYHLFYKTEGHGNGIKKAVTDNLTSGKWKENDSYLQQTDQAVEGASVFSLIGSDKYILMYDVYIAGKYQFTETTDLEHFRVIDEGVSMDFHPRHGTIIPVTAAEAGRLERYWGNARRRTVYQGTDPEAGNPVIRDFHADPAILFARQTGKFYLYPTTDGYEGWGGNSFKAFSSPDLVHWQDEGIILDLPSQVKWADQNAWAPCITEEKIGGKYKYFYYYTAAQKVGVAVADHPTGPFKDSGKPLVDRLPQGGAGDRISYLEARG